MKSLDTNIFVRYLVPDNRGFYNKSRKIFEDVELGKYKVSVSILVINEIIWVLKRYYGIKPNQAVPELIKLLSLKGIVILETKKSVIMQVLSILEKTNIDFTDVYLSRVVKKEKKISFDKDFDKLYKLD